ncbi:MAG: hypothetical protein RLZZ31_1746 [Actinomycetota bacterium]|jgi:hypothetical protein
MAQFLWLQHGKLDGLPAISAAPAHAESGQLAFIAITAITKAGKP